MMRNATITLLLFWCSLAVAQYTPAQLQVLAGQYNSLSDRTLEQSETILLSQLAFSAVLSPSALVNLAVQYAVMSDRQLQQAQVALLNIISTNTPVQPFIGTLMVTNFGQPTYSSYWIYAITNTTTRYVETNGNDGTAVAGDSTKPWATFRGAVDSATAGTRIKFGTGSWNIATTNNGYDVPRRLWLQGNGQSATHLVGTNLATGYWLNFTNDDIVTDLSIEHGSPETGQVFPVVFGPHDGRGGTWSPVTNVLFQNVRIDAGSDTHSPNGDSYVDFVNCQFLSHWDCMSSKYIGSANGPGKIRHFGCLFLSRNDNGSDQTTYVTGPLSSAGFLSCVYPSVNGFFELHDCTIMCTNANGTLGESHPVLNNSTGIIWVDNCTLINQPASTNLNNVPGGLAYYLAVGPGVYISRHSYPDEKLFQCDYAEIIDNSFNYQNGLTPYWNSITNGVYYATNFSAAGLRVTIDPATGSTFSKTLTVTNSAVATGAYSSMGPTGNTNGLAGQFNYLNLQYSTNCGWGGVQSNGTCGTTVTLKGFEEFVVSIGGTIVQLGDATTNLGHHVAITCGGTAVSCGNSVTNAITTVNSQKIAGGTKWTNTAVYSCTQLISDGSNWQICGSRGN